MPVDQWEYWGYNDLGELRLTAYSDYPHDAALLDVSALGKDTNLVKAHLRLYREQGGSLAA